ncbi:MAG: hypothetical protein JWN43_3074 [Gammaproteobacteria bacterium]|nr:hypothetical protein [Gammaproteobacteria bacterium]
MTESWMRSVLTWAVGLLTALITGFFTLLIAIYRKHTERIESNEQRITDLEVGRVTNQQLDAAMSQMRTERRDMHTENQAALSRIEAKMDTNKDTVNLIRTDVAVLTARLPQKRTPRK